MRRRNLNIGLTDERVTVLRRRCDEASLRPRLRVVSPDDSAISEAIGGPPARRCSDCRERIARRRIEALPTATRCLACQLKEETKRAG